MSLETSDLSSHWPCRATWLSCRPVATHRQSRGNLNS